MNPLHTLIARIKRFVWADSAVTEIEALWLIRLLLVEQQLDLVLTIDSKLNELEDKLDPIHYDTLRRSGYTFHADLENARELLARQPEEPNDIDGLFPDIGTVE